MRALLSLILFFVVFLPASAAAHGGVEKTAGDVTVVLNQDPLSPFVGEPVKMSFIFLDAQGNRLKNFSVNLTLTDTFMGDESKDKVVLTKKIQTDVNGVYEFDYTFEKANYFDVDLDFKDSTGADQNTGFLVQTRTNNSDRNRQYTYLISGIIVGLIVGYGVKNLSKSRDIHA